MAETIRWGILSTGNIARKFATGLQALDDAELIAVGSRSQDSADAFGEEFDVPHRHAGYEQLAGDADVDAIYVATPHVFHKRDTLLCLEAGKAVLCEKPFAINVAESREMIDLARERKLFLMEAMWTRFLPVMVKVRELLADGAIGEVRMLTADFGFRSGWNPEGRLLNPELGGGALLDVGVYTVSFAQMVCGRPQQIHGVAHLGETGVDEQAGMVLGFDGGRIAVLHTAVRTQTNHEAVIMGAEGQIRIAPPFWRSQKLTLIPQGGDGQEMELPFAGNGYTHEAAEVGECLRAGKLESDVMPLDETLSVMTTLDELRSQCGLTYPSES